MKNQSESIRLQALDRSWTLFRNQIIDSKGLWLESPTCSNEMKPLSNNSQKLCRKTVLLQPRRKDVSLSLLFGMHLLLVLNRKRRQQYISHLMGLVELRCSCGLTRHQAIRKVLKEIRIHRSRVDEALAQY